MPKELTEYNIASHIPDEPVLVLVLGLCLIALLVLTLPFAIKKVEKNLELFFLIMGLAAVTISGLWSWDIVIEALKAPVMIGSIPIGISQVVLILALWSITLTKDSAMLLPISQINWEEGYSFFSPYLYLVFWPVLYL